MPLDFEDEVRSLERNADRVEVTFWGQAAVYWLKAEALAEELEQARREDRAVRVRFDAATMEILSLV